MRAGACLRGLQTRALEGLRGSQGNEALHIQRGPHSTHWLPLGWWPQRLDEAIIPSACTGDDRYRSTFTTGMKHTCLCCMTQQKGNLPSIKQYDRPQAQHKLWACKVSYLQTSGMMRLSLAAPHGPAAHKCISETLILHFWVCSLHDHSDGRRRAWPSSMASLHEAKWPNGKDPPFAVIHLPIFGLA